MKTELPKNSQHIKNKLGLIKSKILPVGEGKIDKIILFGSYARGDWVKDMYAEDHITYSYESDLDLFFDIHLSESSVGRELTKLIAAGEITKSASAARVKRQKNGSMV